MNNKQCWHYWGTRWELVPHIPKFGKIVKERGIKLVGYAFRLKDYVKISPISLEIFRAGSANDSIPTPFMEPTMTRGKITRHVPVGKIYKYMKCLLRKHHFACVKIYICETNLHSLEPWYSVVSLSSQDEPADVECRPIK